MSKKKVAIFLDAENLTGWIKDGGPTQLLSELGAMGQIIVRRAYANWTNAHMHGFQAELNRQGFELVHSFHPVSGKNSADIQLTVDAMEYALNLQDVDWFVLATGDSDFSPLFRRLREMGREVIGVGPRSALSESVRTSCTRYIFTDSEPENRDADLDDAFDLLGSVLQALDGRATCSELKSRMLNINSAFDERKLGFRSFTEFLEWTGIVDLECDGRDTWYATIRKTDVEQDMNEGMPVAEVYRRLLRKKGWRHVPLDHLREVYYTLADLGPLARSEMVDAVLAQADGQLTATDVRKAIAILWKAKLFAPLDEAGDVALTERKWQLVYREDFIYLVDCAMLGRLTSAIDETGAELATDTVIGMLYGSYDCDQLLQLLHDVSAEQLKAEVSAQQAAAPS